MTPETEVKKAEAVKQPIYIYNNKLMNVIETVFFFISFPFFKCRNSFTTFLFGPLWVWTEKSDPKEILLRCQFQLHPVWMVKDYIYSLKKK